MLHCYKLVFTSSALNIHNLCIVRARPWLDYSHWICGSFRQTMLVITQVLALESLDSFHWIYPIGFLKENCSMIHIIYITYMVVYVTDCSGCMWCSCLVILIVLSQSHLVLQNLNQLNPVGNSHLCWLFPTSVRFLFFAERTVSVKDFLLSV